MGTTDVSVEIIFHGITLTSYNLATAGYGEGSSGDLIFLNSGNAGLSRCEIAATLRREEIGASVSLDTLRKFIRPNDSSVSPLKSRDVLPDGRTLNQLVVNYTVKVTEGVTSMKPYIPRTRGVLYDSSFDNFTIQIFDGKKALKATHDIYPKAVKLPEGTYHIRASFVSKDLDMLEKIQTAALVVDFEVSKAVTLSVHKTLADLLSGGGEASKQTLFKGERATVWVSGGDGSAFPKSASVGDLLVGKLKVTTVGGGKLNLFNVAYLVPPEIKSKETPAALTSPEVSIVPEPPKEESVQLKEAVRDLEISWIKKITKDDVRKELIEKLEKEHGDHLPFLLACIEVAGEKLDKAEKDGALAADVVEQVTKYADTIASLIDTKNLAEYFGLKIDVAAGGEAAKNKKKEMDAQKSALTVALTWRARALRASFTLSDSAGVDSTDIDALSTKFDAALTTLSQWLASPPTSDGKYLALWAWRLERKKSYGGALRAINKYLSDPKNQDGENAAIWKELVEVKKRILTNLGWTIWNQYEEKWSIIKSPPDYAPF
ncbi:tripeptidyl-peptidase II Tpp2 [Phlyctochytrium planicorne]|nr:tripeptidyl-peptidase II Tpp2 [Phlyctochytrium planicorne]